MQPKESFAQIIPTKPSALAQLVKLLDSPEIELELASELGCPLRKVVQRGLEHQFDILASAENDWITQAENALQCSAEDKADNWLCLAYPWEIEESPKADTAVAPAHVLRKARALRNAAIFKPEKLSEHVELRPVGAPVAYYLEPEDRDDSEGHDDDGNDRVTLTEWVQLFAIVPKAELLGDDDAPSHHLARSLQLVFGVILDYT